MKKLLVVLMIVLFSVAANAELVLRLVGSDFVEESSIWTDTSGKGNDATVWTGDPQKVTGVSPYLAGDVVRFDGDDGLELDVEIPVLSDVDGYTVFMTIKNDNTSWSTPLCSSDSGGYMNEFGADQLLHAVRMNQADLGTNDTAVSGFNIFTNRANDAGGIFRLNGVPDGTHNGSSFVNGIKYIGTLQPWYTSERFIGDIAEIRIYNTQLNDTEMAAVEAAMVIPEPATMILLGLGGLLIRRRR